MTNAISQAASLMGKKGAEQRNKNLSKERRVEIAKKAGQANLGKKKNRLTDISIKELNRLRQKGFEITEVSSPTGIKK